MLHHGATRGDSGCLSYLNLHTTSFSANGRLFAKPQMTSYIYMNVFRVNSSDGVETQVKGCTRFKMGPMAWVEEIHII
jgi:hypothetical protein